MKDQADNEPRKFSAGAYLEDSEGQTPHKQGRLWGPNVGHERCGLNKRRQEEHKGAVHMVNKRWGFSPFHTPPLSP